MAAYNVKVSLKRANLYNGPKTIPDKIVTVQVFGANIAEAGRNANGQVSWNNYGYVTYISNPSSDIVEFNTCAIKPKQYIGV